MNKFFGSKLFLTLEHAGKIAVFTALSAFVAELMNSDFASLLTHHLPTLVTVGLINIILAAALRWLNLKKAEAEVELAKPEAPVEVTPAAEVSA